MNYTVIIYFNERGRRLVERHKKVLRMDCKEEEIGSVMYEYVPESLIDRFEVVAEFGRVLVEHTLVKVTHESDPMISYFGEIICVEPIEDQYRVYLYDLNDEIRIKIKTGKGKYHKQTYILHHIEDEDELREAHKKSVSIRKTLINDILGLISESLPIIKLKNILKAIEE